MLIKNRRREEGVYISTYTCFPCLLRTICPIYVSHIVPLSRLALGTTGSGVLNHMIAPNFEVVLNEQIFVVMVFVVMVIGRLEPFIYS